MASSVRIADGQFDFSQGVNSNRIPMMASALNPNGIKRNQIAWASNATVREGGIRSRTGWSRRVETNNAGLWQGGAIYTPEFANPYLICSISGRIYKVLLESPYTITDLSAVSGLTNPATVTEAFFCQGEQFMVIQAGDYGTVAVPTLPLFWDGTTLRRSIGITNPLYAGPSVPGINEIPAATCMDYYQGRLWYAQGRTASAGDIVFGASGTLAYNFTDAILNVTENPASIGGDGFSVASNAGNIRSLAHTANINNQLGDSELYMSTRRTMYALSVPHTRSAWIAATTSNLPDQRIIQRTNGTVSSKSMVAINGDLFYASTDGIRTLRTVLRSQTQWGNVPISSDIMRCTQFNDLSIMRTASGITFDNRLLMTQLPRQTASGVVFDALAVLDFDVISTLQEQLPPAWEGIYEGLQFLQLFEGDFGGRPRAFAMVLSSLTSKIELWEITDSDKFDNADNSATDSRVQWWFETPRYNWAESGQELELKCLDGLEIWLDKILGTVNATVEYRVDSDPCWVYWHQFTTCNARSSCENVTNPVCYPEQPYREGYRWTIQLPKPPYPECKNGGTRPGNVGYSFQMRITFRGWCRVVGLIAFATTRERAPYGSVTCA